MTTNWIYDKTLYVQYPILHELRKLYTIPDGVDGDSLQVCYWLDSLQLSWKFLTIWMGNGFCRIGPCSHNCPDTEHTNCAQNWKRNCNKKLQKPHSVLHIKDSLRLSTCMAIIKTFTFRLLSWWTYENLGRMIQEDFQQTNKNQKLVLWFRQEGMWVKEIGKIGL